MSETDAKTEKKQRYPNAWKPGECPNPKGRPRKGNTLADAMREYLDQKIDGRDETRKDVFVKAMYASAIKGNGISQRIYANYVDGMPKEYKPQEPYDETVTEARLYRLYKMLSPDQRKVIDQIEGGAKLIVNNWGRRSGKTELNGALPIYCAARWADCEVTYIHLTGKNAGEQAVPKVMDAAEKMGLSVEYNATKGYIEHGNGGKIYFTGNETKDDREKMLGYGKARRMVIIDECQSQKELKTVIDEKLLATFIDCDAILVLSGTKSRIRGSYWEHMYTDEQPGKIINKTNMFSNPYLTDPMKVLEGLLMRRGLSMNDPLVRREFFNEDVYDTDALVFRFADINYYGDSDFEEWRRTVPATDIRAICGLDLGYEDANAVCTIVYATNSPYLWCVHERTVRRQSLSDLVSIVSEAVQVGRGYSASNVYCMTDMGGLGKSIGMTLASEYKLPVMAAEKHGKEGAVELLAELIRTGKYRVRKESLFVADALKIVYQRDDLDNIIRVIDDSTFHSDISDAVLYAVRGAKNTMRA
jgi:hypothetical protein